MVTWMTMPEDQTEREKFLRLYGACEKRVYAAAFRVLRDPAPTEDAAQQAWLRLLQSWERVSTFGLEEACGYAVTVAKKDSQRAFFSRGKMHRDAQRISGRGQQNPQQRQQTPKKRNNQGLE